MQDPVRSTNQKQTRSQDTHARDQGTKTGDRCPRILVADDDPLVIRLLVRIFRRQGWDVVQVSNGLEAIEAWPPDREDFDLVVLDVRMPRLGGYEAYLELKRLHPQARFLFITAYGDDEILEQIQALRLPLLFKPFDIPSLIRAVAELVGDEG